MITFLYIKSGKKRFIKTRVKGHPHKVDPSGDCTRKNWKGKGKLLVYISNNIFASIKQGIPIIPPRYIHVYLKGKEV